jgi:hypothetical protein
MNAAQATRLARLLTEAEHPRTCPITGERYTPEELAELGEPRAQVKGYEHGDHETPEMLEVLLSLPAFQRARTLHLDAAGQVWTWSTVQIPADECPCECPGPPESKVDRSGCPVHGDSIRELDCYRRVTAIGWEPQDAPHPLRGLTRRESVRVGDAVVGVDVPVSPATWTRWAYLVREGEPIRDVLAEYRAHVKALAA